MTVNVCVEDALLEIHEMNVLGFTCMVALLVPLKLTDLVVLFSVNYVL